MVLPVEAQGGVTLTSRMRGAVPREEGNNKDFEEFVSLLEM